MNRKILVASVLALGVAILLAIQVSALPNIPFLDGSNLIAGHLEAGAKPSQYCRACHGSKDSPAATDPQTGTTEQTLDANYKSVHVLHLTSPFLQLDCTHCHVSVDLLGKSGAHLRRQVHMALCGTCHSPVPNAAHAAYSAKQCRQCHTGEHTSAPLYVNREYLAGDIDCTKCHGGEAAQLFAGRTEERPDRATGAVSGLVALASGTPVAGLSVEVRQDGRRVALGLSTGAAGTNYQILNVPPGQVTVQIANPGHQASRTVSVLPGQVADVDFTVSPLVTLPAGYSEISLPFDYVQFVPSDAAEVLGIAPESLKLAAVQGATGTSDYAVYPNAPANRFEAGRGYQILLEAAVPVVVSGKTVTDPLTHVPLTRGWNMIGQPYLKAVAWSRVRVQTSAGRVLSLEQAKRAGVVGRVLWKLGANGYERATSLEPYVGYWVYAKENCTLLIPRP